MRVETSKILPSITIFLVGLWANLAQIASLRIFLGFFYGTEIHISLFLGLWLLLISVGSILTLLSFVKSLNSAMTIMAFGPYISILLLYTFFSYLPFISQNITGTLVKFELVFIALFIIILPLALPIGMIVPLAVKSFKSLKLGRAYYYESLGSFCGGILFSIILQGTANSIETILSIPLLILICKFLNSNIRNKKNFWLGLIIVLPLFIYKFCSSIKNTLENKYWKNIAPYYTLLDSKETKYQKINLLKYAEQYSLYSNSQLITTWPNEAKIKEKIHSFITSAYYCNSANIGIIGVPSAEFIKELMYWSPRRIVIIDLDKDLIEYALGKLISLNDNKTAKLKTFKFSELKLDSNTSIFSSSLQISTYTEVIFINEDPRALHKNIYEKFDLLFVLFSEPNTLLINRFFTLEGIKDIKKLLKDEGVLNIEVTGAENYFSNEIESIILSTYLSLLHSFKKILIVPGYPIHFWATDNNQNLSNDPKTLDYRYRSLKISNPSFAIPNFDSKFFYSILLDFRIKELEKLIKKLELPKDKNKYTNKDYHPAVFIRQLQLWNKFSDSLYTKLIKFFENPQILYLFAILIGFFLLFFIIRISIFKCKNAVLDLLSIGVAISGSIGLLSETILILVYQNRYGAVFYMSAFFFGIYMLGLALGAYIGEKKEINKFFHLVILKAMQLCMTIICLFIILYESVQTFIYISLGIFTIAFLDGIEFPAVDNIYIRNNLNNSYSASILTFSDNLGASMIGFLGSIWLIPAYGYINLLFYSAITIFINLLLLILANFYVYKDYNKNKSF